MRSSICLDIGGTSTKAGVVSGAGQLEFRDQVRTEPDAERYFQSLCELIDRTIAQAERRGDSLAGLGVSVAGFLNDARDRMIYNPNLPWLEQFPLRTRLKDRVDLEVELETDSNAACVAEYRFGSGHGSRRFLCVTVGTGMGVGMTVDGAPVRIAYGCLGDIGHIIVEPGGALCSCGGRGCAEALLSAPRLAQRFAEESHSSESASLRDVIRAAESGDLIARAICEQAGNYLGLALASMANILFPDRIAIAGGLSAAGDLVLEPAARTFRKSTSVLARTDVTVARAVLGAEAPLIGAGRPFWKRPLL